VIDAEDIKNVGEKIDFNRFNDKSVLLIGSNGFLGNWFKEIFRKYNVTYTTYDILEDKDNDICFPFRNVPRHDYVINCAGIASPEKYMVQPISTLDISYIGTKNVLDWCVDQQVESVIMFSSSEVYGTPEPENIPTTEEYEGRIPTRKNRSCYDIGKQVLETLCHVYYNQYQVPVKVMRPFNFYGPYMGVNDNRVLSNWMRNYLNNEDIVVYGDGKQTRTFCYAGDGISMILGVLLYGKNGEVYNVGNPSPEVTLMKMAEIFCDILNYEKRIAIEKYPDFYPSDEPQRRCPNIDKIVKHTNIVPSTSIKTGLYKMLEYYKSRQNI